MYAGSMSLDQNDMFTLHATLLFVLPYCSFAAPVPLLEWTRLISFLIAYVLTLTNQQRS